MEIQKLLPAQYHNHLPLFEGDIAAELSLYRPGINYIFTLEKGKNEREKYPPWGLSYRIIRDELLIIRKTLNELLNKGFIYTNNCLIRAPVIFIKMEGGL